MVPPLRFNSNSSGAIGTEGRCSVNKKFAPPKDSSIEPPQSSLGSSRDASAA